MMVAGLAMPNCPDFVIVFLVYFCYLMVCLFSLVYLVQVVVVLVVLLQVDFPRYFQIPKCVGSTVGGLDYEL
jgi:hypothetical protein